MKKRFLLFFFMIVLSSGISAQCVNFILQTQNDVDNFPAGCTVVSGGIYIAIGNITNLNGLSNVVQINGFLQILAKNLTDLSGLNNLQSVGGDLVISNINSLTSLNGLEKLVHAEKNVTIKGNPLLANLDGLGSLTTIEGNMSLSNNGFTDLSGLNSLSSVGSLSISNNTKLINLNGMEHLAEVKKAMTISNNQKLTDITGLSGLKAVGLEGINPANGSLNITNNPLLSCLIGLDSLALIGGNLNITDNAELISLRGIESLDSVGGDIRIYNNYHLYACDLPNLCSLLGEVGAVSIYNNDPGCNSLAEVISACGVPGNCDANINLWNQYHIDRFPEIFEGCTHIQGNLGIYLSQTIGNLDGLAQVVSVAGDFFIDGSVANDTLSNLSGLHNLQVVGGDFYLHHVNSMENLAGLESLQSVGGNFSLAFNPSLINFTGLSGLASIGKGLSVSYHQKLKTTAGLQNLESIGQFIGFYNNNGLEDLAGLNQVAELAGSCYISNNPSLSSITGISGLKHIGGDLTLSYNNSLGSLFGLNNLKDVGNDLYITEIPALTTLNGLEGLESVGGSLNISDLDNLTSLWALENLKEISGLLIITLNPSLTECHVLAICNYLSPTPGYFGVNSNGQGCKTTSQILAACSNTFSRVNGRVFADINCNSTFDAEDGPAPYRLLRNASDQMPFAFTKNDGTYRRFLAPNSNFSFIAEPVFGFTAVPDSQSVATGSFPQEFNGYDFSLCPDNPIHNLRAGITPLAPARPGFSHNYQIDVENLGNFTENAILSFDFSGNPSSGYAAIINAAGGAVVDNTIEWYFQNIKPFEVRSLQITVLMSASTPLGELLYPHVSVALPSGYDDADPSDNSATLAQEVVGSFDPNDKTVSPVEIGVEIYELGKDMIFLIRFQNTGTYPATFVEVLDTLEQQLDLSTFRMLAASHAYELSFLENRVLKWRFDNINLPDSTSNEPQSHGFIKFSIRAIGGLGVGDEIANKASIYFDYNDPIITNTATSNIVLTSSVKVPEKELDFDIFPNPANGIIQFQFSEIVDAGGEIRIWNVSGALCMKEKVEGLSDRVSLDDLPSGIYFIQVISAGKRSGVKKLIKLN